MQRDGKGNSDDRAGISYFVLASLRLCVIVGRNLIGNTSMDVCARSSPDLVVEPTPLAATL